MNEETERQSSPEGPSGRSVCRVQSFQSYESYETEANANTFTTYLTAYRVQSEILAGHEEVALVSPNMFRFIIAIVILANTVQLGWCVDSDTIDASCVASEVGFTFIFVIEMVLKLLAQGLNYFKAIWNIMDFSLIFLSVVDLLTLVILDKNCNMCEEVSLIRLLKLLRTLRVFRILRAKQELAILVEGLFASLKAMVWVAVLLLVLVYAGGIFCAEAFRGTIPNLNLQEDYFGTLLDSMMTLFSISVLDIWDDVVRPLVKVQPVAIIFFIGYIFISSFGILNLLIGIITESAHKATLDFKHQQIIQQRLEQMKEISADAEELFVEDRLLSAIDMENADPRLLRKLLEVIDLPQGFRVEDLHLMCSPNQKISKDEFLDAMRRCVFCNDFERDCLFQHSMNDLRRRLMSVEDDLRKIRKVLNTGMVRPSSPRDVQMMGTRSSQLNSPGRNSYRASADFDVPNGDVPNGEDSNETFVNLHAAEVARKDKEQAKVGVDVRDLRDSPDSMPDTFPKDITATSDSCRAPHTGEQANPRRLSVWAEESAETYPSCIDEANLRESFLSLEYQMKSEIWQMKESLQRDLASEFRNLFGVYEEDKGSKYANHFVQVSQHEQGNLPTDSRTRGKGAHSNKQARSNRGIYQHANPHDTAQPSPSVVGSYAGRAAAEIPRNELTRVLRDPDNTGENSHRAERQARKQPRQSREQDPSGFIAALRYGSSIDAETDRENIRDV